LAPGAPLRYAVVSLTTALLGQVVLVVLYSMGLSAPRANLAAFLVAAVPSYYCTRRWTFRARGPTRWVSEVLPFWVFTAVHLLASTATATLAASVAQTRPGGRSVHGLLISAVVLLTGLGLWVLKYFALRATFLRPVDDP